MVRPGEPGHEAELPAHCYRMLASVHDADEAEPAARCELLESVQPACVKVADLLVDTRRWDGDDRVLLRHAVAA